jgi:hypothetical protein
MGWKKAQLIDQAFSELARAGYVFDLGADVREDALRQLDTMMATWSSVGISIGYLLPTSPDDSNIDDDAGIPLTAVETVYQNLAVKLAAGRGKTLTAQTLAAAQSGYNILLGAAVTPTTGQCSGLPRIGAGNKPWRCF